MSDMFIGQDFPMCHYSYVLKGTFDFSVIYTVDYFT